MNLKWQPAIYEHKAALIGRRPVEVSRSADLLTSAVLKEFERNISPARLAAGDAEELAAAFIGDLEHFARPIAGTGILPYDFDPKRYLRFRSFVSM